MHAIRVYETRWKIARPGESTGFDPGTTTEYDVHKLDVNDDTTAIDQAITFLRDQKMVSPNGTVLPDAYSTTGAPSTEGKKNGIGHSYTGVLEGFSDDELWKIYEVMAPHW